MVRRTAYLLAVGGLALGLALPAAAQAAETAASHAADDAVVISAIEEQRMQGVTRAATAADAARAAAGVSADPHVAGRWSAPVPWPVVGVHVALQPDGTVLAYDSVGDLPSESYEVHKSTRATLWDPATGAQRDAAVDTGYNIFCSGLAHLPDGRLFVAGGNKDAQLDGIRQTHTFEDGRWVLGQDMAWERWYPTVTALADGEMLVTSGRITPGHDVFTPEVRRPDGSLRALPGAGSWLPLYPWIDVAPDGRAFVSGPAPAMQSIDTAGAGARQVWPDRDAVDRDYGSHAMFDVGRVLVAGGGPSEASASVVDVRGQEPSVTPTQPMAFGRRQHNLTVLADGSVLATGGNSSGAGLVDLDNGVYDAERWDPATGSWTTLAAAEQTRQYHSSALLLPDGRVLTAGGGICGWCQKVGYLAKDAEVFSPPYLFAADGSPAVRPRVEDVAGAVTYGGALRVTTPDAAAVRDVALIRLGAVTHSNNMEQRRVPLAFTADADGLTATGPENANIAPPGVYMLFVVDEHGVPSVARMVRVLDGVAPSVALTRPAADEHATAPGPVTLAATGTDADGSVAKVEWRVGSRVVATDDTAPWAAQWSGAEAGTYAVTARATDDDGLVATSAATRLVVDPTPKPPVDGAGSPGTATDAGTAASPGTATDAATGASPATATDPASATDAATATDPASATHPPPAPAPVTPAVGASPRSPISGLSVTGSRSRGVRLALTATRGTTLRIALAKRRAGRWVPLVGELRATVRAGRQRVVLGRPWAGPRGLPAGSYRALVRAGVRSVTVAFVVR